MNRFRSRAGGVARAPEHQGQAEQRHPHRAEHRHRPHVRELVGRHAEQPAVQDQPEQHDHQAQDAAEVARAPADGRDPPDVVARGDPQQHPVVEDARDLLHHRRDRQQDHAEEQVLGEGLHEPAARGRGDHQHRGDAEHQPPAPGPVRPGAHQRRQQGEQDAGDRLGVGPGRLAAGVIAGHRPGHVDREDERDHHRVQGRGPEVPGPPGAQLPPGRPARLGHCPLGGGWSLGRSHTGRLVRRAARRQEAISVRRPGVRGAGRTRSSPRSAPPRPGPGSRAAAGGRTRPAPTTRAPTPRR